MRIPIITLIFFVTHLYSDIAVNSPVAWTTVRTGNMSVQLIGDSASVGSSKKFTLKKISRGKTKIISSTKQKVDNQSFSFVYKLPKVVVGGNEYYAISWVGSNGDEVIVAPIGSSYIDPVSDNNSIYASTNVIKDTQEYLKVHGVKIGDAKVAFAWTPDKLIIVVEGEVSIGIDPGNLKNSFATFSNRFVTTRLDTDQNFYYVSRTITSTDISYTPMIWKGDMSLISSDTKVIEIPWYELGIKSFTGRQIGTSLFIKGNSYPKDAQKYNPSTWGNLILK